MVLRPAVGVPFAQSRYSVAVDKYFRQRVGIYQPQIACFRMGDVAERRCRRPDPWRAPLLAS